MKKIRSRTLPLLPLALVTALLLTGCPANGGNTSPEEMERNPPIVSTDGPSPAST